VAAKTSVQIVTPYLLPPRWLIALLDQAIHRGIIVEFLVPEDTDYKLVNKVNYLYACLLTGLGVKFYMMPRMNHAKIMLIDAEEGVIGSQNMDILSFNLNMEVGVFFRQKNLVSNLSRIIEHWKKESTLFESPGKKIKLSDRFLMMILKLFYPIF
jgi:cardiolipin synthase